MRPLETLIPLHEAMRHLLDAVTPVQDVEALPLVAAVGRVTAAAVLSSVDVPAFDRAAMDGYALRAEDAALAPLRLQCVEALYAGSMPVRRVEAGLCSEIATGAPLPPGADAVVMVESTRRDGDWIEVLAPVRKGQHVTRRGADIVQGEEVVAAGTVLTPARIGALAAVGQTTVHAWRRPRVTIGSTGSEVREPGAPLEPGQVYNVNSFTLRALMESLGCEVRTLPVAPDDVEIIRERVESALQSDPRPDLLLMTGGSSVGEKDVLQDVLGAMGEIVFHGIALKPGKPTLLARVRGTPVVGMPGYPTSCLSNGYLLLVPAVERLARRPRRHGGSVRVPAAEDMPSLPDKHQVVTVRLVDGRATRAFKESGVITSMSRADGFIEIPEGVDRVAAGEIVEVTLL